MNVSMKLWEVKIFITPILCQVIPMFLYKDLVNQEQLQEELTHCEDFTKLLYCLSPKCNCFFCVNLKCFPHSKVKIYSQTAKKVISMWAFLFCEHIVAYKDKHLPKLRLNIGISIKVKVQTFIMSRSVLASE